MKPLQDLSLFKLPKNFRGRPAVYVQLWWFIQGTFFALSPQFMYGWRRLLLKAFGAKIGNNVLVRPSATVTYPWKLSIGDNSWIGDNVKIYNLGEIAIGENSVISQESYLCTGSHDHSSKDFSIFAKPITIGNGCWIASDVFVYPGINIADNVVVGARSTVTKDLASDLIYMGSPAIPVKTRTINQQIKA
ncbi:Galactoside O-acetyltransferase [compost metagenome]